MIPLLGNCPRAGSGVHRYIFATACRCMEAKIPEHLAAELIRQQTRGCGRRVPAYEIEGAIRDAKAKVLKQPVYHRQPSTPDAPAWPKLDVAKRSLIVKHGIGASDLCDLSPSCLDRDAEGFIDVLFPGDPLLCVGKSEWQFATRRREIWRGHLNRLSHLVPNPMSARQGLTKDGTWSERTRNNTGERLYLVLDYDAGETDEHAAILWFLAQKRPLKLVMHSAHKSLHGWFKVACVPEEALLAFMEEAVSLGADPGLWWKEHSARIPGGWRDDRKAKGRQSVLYLNESL